MCSDRTLPENKFEAIVAEVKRRNEEAGKTSVAE